MESSWAKYFSACSSRLMQCLWLPSPHYSIAQRSTPLNPGSMSQKRSLPVTGTIIEMHAAFDSNAEPVPQHCMRATLTFKTNLGAVSSILQAALYAGNPVDHWELQRIAHWAPDLISDHSLISSGTLRSLAPAETSPPSPPVSMQKLRLPSGFKTKQRTTCDGSSPMTGC